MSRTIETLKKYLCLALIRILNYLPIQTNKIFIFSYYGSQYGCNPKYISEYIIRHAPKGQFDLVWAFTDPKRMGHIPHIRIVKMMSFRYFYELCTSKVVITNFRTTDLFVKRKNQYYIQTWHSSLRLKQIEKDAENSLPETYLQMAVKDSKKCDLLLSGCEFSTQIFSRAFWYEGEIFEHGTPRNDVLFKNDPRLKEAILEKMDVPGDRRILLYAPTFRKNNSLAVYDLDYAGILNALRKKFGGSWVCLVKLHPHLLSKSSQLTFGDEVIDVTGYDDIQELLSISDVLISDYSSLMFDFSITQRPCFLYIPDFKEYINHDRNLYFDLLDLPFKTAMDNESLLSEIRLFQAEEYKNQLVQFFNEIGSFENGKASEQLVNRINEVCFGFQRRRVYEAV